MLKLEPNAEAHCAFPQLRDDEIRSRQSARAAAMRLRLQRCQSLPHLSGNGFPPVTVCLFFLWNQVLITGVVLYEGAAGLKLGMVAWSIPSTESVLPALRSLLNYYCFLKSLLQNYWCCRNDLTILEARLQDREHRSQKKKLRSAYFCLVKVRYRKPKHRPASRVRGNIFYYRVSFGVEYVWISYNELY